MSGQFKSTGDTGMNLTLSDRRFHGDAGRFCSTHGHRNASHAVLHGTAKRRTSQNFYHGTRDKSHLHQTRRNAAGTANCGYNRRGSWWQVRQMEGVHSSIAPKIRKGSQLKVPKLQRYWLSPIGKASVE